MQAQTPRKSSSQRKSSKSAGKSKKAAGKSKPLRHSYLEMVQVALLTLNEASGSTRQEIWKCMQAKFPEADQKRFMVQLKKMLASDGPVVKGKNNARIALEKNFRARANKRIAAGEPLQKAMMPKKMMDPVKAKMAADKKKAAKKAKTAAAKAKPRYVYSILKTHGQSSRCQVALLLSLAQVR